MKKYSPEYYWESIKEKSEKGDFKGATQDFYKLIELDSDYKEYCYHMRDKEGGDFLVPMIDYYWWKEEINGEGEEDELESDVGGTVSSVYKLKSRYDFEKGIFAAVCDFIDITDYPPDMIVFNKHTYNQIRHILSISSMLRLYGGKRGEREINFNSIEIDYKSKEENSEALSENDSKSSSFQSYRMHQTDIYFDNCDDLYYTDKNKMRTILSKLSNSEGENEYELHIKNPFGTDYVQFDDSFSDTLVCMFDEELSDMEFELIRFGEDDDEDDFDDNIPDLPEGGVVKKKELVYDLE